MKVLVIGSGAREHALAWKLAQSKLVTDVVFWPDSTNLSACGRLLSGAPTWHEALLDAKAKAVDFVVVGPEGPLAEGIADAGAELGLPVFGPNRTAAQLESSKAFAKAVMASAQIPTAAYQVFENLTDCAQAAHEFLARRGGVVLKADGLASGKGVFVCDDTASLNDALSKLKTDLGTAAARVVLEEKLTGPECSFFVLLGQKEPLPLGFAVDAKRLKDGDLGPNTGGMGCYTPVPWLPGNAEDIVMTKVLRPLLEELAKRGITYQGCLYIGLMWTENGPHVIEFNVRFGDPEAQVLAVADQRDWGAAIAFQLGLVSALPSNFREQKWEPAVAAVMAGANYPYGGGTPASIALPDGWLAPDHGQSVIFGAQLKREAPDKYVTGSGRVLTVVAHGATLIEAEERAYERVNDIAQRWPEAQFRRDLVRRHTHLKEMP